MNPVDPERLIRRILVALDASPQSLAALEAAAELAATLEAELLGLFVEDVNLRRLAELPIAREVSLLSGRGHPFEGPEEVELQLRAQADRARRSLEQVARKARLPWSFRSVRGEVTAEVLRAGESHDLMTLGGVGWSVSARPRLGSTAREAVRKRRGMTLIHQAGATKDLPVVVLYDDSDSARQALAVAGQLASTRGASLRLVLLTADEEEARGMRAWASDWLGERGLAAEFRQLAEAGKQALARALACDGRGLVVVPGDSPHLPEDLVSFLMTSIECPVLVVR